MKPNKPLTKNQVIARVSNWEAYCWARAKEDDSKGDIPGAMTWRAEANISRHDIAWLRRDTNWRDFESKPYALGQAHPWTFVYPAEISTPMPWDLLRRMAATLIEA
jgi:hypothetical protein